MEAFQERMLFEYNELTERIEKLINFMNTDMFKQKLSEEERNLMFEQLNGMSIYSKALRQRLKLQTLI